VHASVAFFLVEGRLRKGVRISPGARLPRALLPTRPSPHAPHAPGDGRALRSIRSGRHRSISSSVRRPPLWTASRGCDQRIRPQETAMQIERSVTR
jgi:hypothetical protein